MSGIFISYRRQDSDAYAGRLYDRLSTRFGKARIFMDIDMDLGLDFVKEIRQRVGSCEALIAVIGRSWLDVKDDEGRRRLDDPKDWVRLEIAAALERDIPVIPALVGGAKMPGTSDLPRVLSRLTRRQAIEISHTGFHPDVDRLIQGLERILPSKKTKSKKPGTRRRTADADSEATSTRTTVKLSKPSRKVESPEGIYFDSETQLMWTIKDNGKDVNWHDANKYAQKLRLGGYSDWRLPTIDELEKLYDSGELDIRKPFRLTGRSRWVWSSTVTEFEDSAWYFSFVSGIRELDLLGFSNFRALCVRGLEE
jgi:Protein of unknown function (DUF1566)/TIR domain